MTYAETLEYLYSRLPMFSRIGAAAYKADLQNTIQLCNALGNPHSKFKSIHIAGTNGKGSVSHMLASVLQEAGYKTGLYTSPHLRDFRERIRINGRMITQENVIAFTEKVKPLIASIEPSFFEITVAMAFEWFANEEVDIAVIETGLGGRLDSTNVIRPELSVITNVGWDHMDLLGDSLEKIAAEKAGIIKEHIPVVVGEWSGDTAEVFKKVAGEKNASLTFADQTRKALNWYWIKHQLVVEIARGNAVDHEIYRLDLPGIYQVKNLVTVLQSIDVLRHRGWNVSQHQVDKGLAQVKKNTGLHGRWEIIYEHPLTVLDVAHNKEGIAQLIQQIEVTTYHELHLIIGFVKDKDVTGILSMLPANAHYYFTQARIPRAMPSGELAEKAHAVGLNGNAFENVNDALREARLRARQDDLIVICGSVFLVGEVV